MAGAGGYLGLKFPREYGGGDDPVAAAGLVEELAHCGSGGVAAGLGAHAGISFLLIDRGDGVRCSLLRKLGWHAADTAEISLDDVFVPTENLLGRLHGGFYLIMANFQWERLLMALGAVGAMQACFEVTLDAVREVTIAKLGTQRAAVDAIDACLRVLGLDAPPELERALRDACLGPIGGGTDEIMKEILGRSLGL